MTKDEAVRLALEALEDIGDEWGFTSQRTVPKRKEAITAIKAALEAKDEPVAYINVEQRKLEWAKYMSWDTPTVVNLPKIPLYTTPPQRPWVVLTDEEINLIYAEPQTHIGQYARAIEAKLKEKNS